MSCSNTSRRASQMNGSRPSPLKIQKAPAATKSTRRNPVIIYTHSPKIIHAQPRDFMALVQNLTGMAKVVPPPDLNASDGGGALDSLSPVTNHVINSIFGDFTPNSSGDFFCSPRPVYRFSAPNSLSPSVMEGLPEY